MGLLPATGQRSTRQRLLRACILIVLSVGGVAMALPFLIMMSGATRTGVDAHSFRILPRFLTDDEVLYQKYIEGLYNESPAQLRAAWEEDIDTFDQVTLLETVDLEQVQAWNALVSSAPWHELRAGFVYAPSSRHRPILVRSFLNQKRRQHQGDLSRLNQDLHTSFATWNAFQVLPPDSRSREGFVEPSAWWMAWYVHLQKFAPTWTVGVHNLNGFYHERVTRVRQGADAPRIFWEDAPSEDRELFLRGVVNPEWVCISSKATPEWQAFLKARYKTLEGLFQATGVTAKRWDRITLPRDILLGTNGWRFRADWLAFLEGWIDLSDGQRYEAPLEHLSLVGTELTWREETGTAPPIRMWDQWQFETHKAHIRKTFLTQNYAAAWEILIRDGRGLWVTLMYCGGSVLLALLVNPLAAYALSRFRPKHTYALLLYLLMTMAFPPMVTQIPLFLMLRDYGLLNSYWALWLPGMVHGYSIFLLKGFFDSLPRDLYESAALDGAGELRIFFTITLGLSKPILAVIALQAFVTAYTAFMFALLICQDPEMWTLMVWLYQLQQTYGPGVQNAAYVFAAIPTLTVFLLAQRHILKGIVIPTEK